MPSTIELKIWRQDTQDGKGYWEEFSLPYQPNMNVISALMEIQVKPVNKAGQAVNPVVWESNCLEEVCGACSMVINGVPRQACAALIDKLEQPITIRPLSKFRTVRDLIVDRTPMFQALAKVKAWIPIDGTYDLGPGPRVAPEDQEINYVLSTCMTCGCCLEVCPQVSETTAFIGAAAISQARLFNNHPTGKMNASDRLHALMPPGGVSDCGKAANCVKACPKGIPLTSSIAEMARDTTVQALKDFFYRDERKGGSGPG